MQIRVYLVCLVATAQIALWIQRHPPQLPYQALNPLAIDRPVMIFQPIANPARAVVRMLQIAFIEQASNSKSSLETTWC